MQIFISQVKDLLHSTCSSVLLTLAERDLSTSFPGLSPTRYVGRVEGDPGNEVESPILETREFWKRVLRLDWTENSMKHTLSRV